MSRRPRLLVGLEHWRNLDGFSRVQLAQRSGLSAAAILRLEQRRPGQPESIRRLADARLVAPSMLINHTDLDDLVDEPLRTCTECHGLRPLRAFVKIRATVSGYYGRCRVCRARRERARYQSDPDYRQLVIARSRRNRLRQTPAVAEQGPVRLGKWVVAAWSTSSVLAGAGLGPLRADRDSPDEL